jgi:hypothetical protein
MIINNKIDIKITNSIVNYYKNKGYKCNIGDNIQIDVNDLPKQSTKIIKVKCDICDNIKDIQYRYYINNIKNQNFYTCSLSCSQIKIKNTKLKNHGDKNFSNIEKRRKTCKEKYDNETYKNVKKREITNIEKYGFKDVIMNENVKKKRQKTYIEKYGYEHPMQNINILNKKKKTSMKKYNNENYTNVKKMKITSANNNIEKMKKKYNLDILLYNKEYFIKCDKGHIYKINYDVLQKRYLYEVTMCTICNPIDYKISDMEKQVKKFIKDNCKLIIEKSRNIIKPYELDIYIPDLKLAFEFNGLYWHNELYKDKNYHLNKTELCEKNGIQLIHIYEDDWLYKQDIVKSMILNKLGKTSNKIYARKCEIREITDNKLVREFLDKNHVQGFIGSKIKIGLFYKDELVSLMTFGKRRVAMGKKTSDEGEFELLRFCSKLNTNVVGGGNKLFKHFVKNYDPKIITTYVDRSWSQGNLYKQLGFKCEGKTEPNYYYIIDRIRHHRFNFRKDVLVKEGYDPELTEHKIMLNRKIYRIFDSGNLKFEY